MDRDLVRLSKFISLVLRHQPARFGLQLDAEGWVAVAELLAAADRAGVGLTPALLGRVVAENDKQRFAISADGLRIRARQGHSVPVDLGLAAAEPPARLFHGTTDRALPEIRVQGLLRQQRHHVHLAADAATARRVGGRHGRPAVLEIDAAAMRAAGIVFYQTDNGVWLVEAVPPNYIIFPAAS